MFTKVTRGPACGELFAMVEIPPWFGSWEDLGVCLGRSWAHGELSTMAKVLPQLGSWENMGVSRGRSQASLWGALHNGRGASPVGPLGKSQHLPRLLTNWAHMELSTMATLTPRLGS
jgi:hypothetical protein